jgi:hypothetical protein
MEKIFNQKILKILFGHLWVVELTQRYIFVCKVNLRCKQSDLFPLFATGINHTSSAGGKFTASLLDTGVVDTGGKFAASVVDSGGKFFGAPCLANISANSKKRN